MAPTTSAGLTPAQISFFNENGYLLLPDEFSPEMVDKLMERSHKLLREFSLEGHPMTKFSTGEGDGEGEGGKHVGDEYFLTSGDKVRFFFEEDAFDKEGNLVKSKERAINKIGHGLHLLDPLFRSITLTPRNKAIARSLSIPNPSILQSMIICKQPEIGGAVPSHQDSTFLYTDPPSAVGFWYALEDTTVNNGCLSFVPGSHRWEPVRKRFVRVREENGKVGTGFMDLPEGAGDGLAAVGGKRRFEKEGMVPKEEFVMGEVKRGTLVLIHGNVLHKSERNLSGKSRHIYTFHSICGDYKYDELNWLQPTGEGFSRLENVEG